MKYRIKKNKYHQYYIERKLWSGWAAITEYIYEYGEGYNICTRSFSNLEKAEGHIKFLCRGHQPDPIIKEIEC